MTIERKAETDPDSHLYPLLALWGYPINELNPGAAAILFRFVVSDSNDERLKELADQAVTDLVQRGAFERARFDQLSGAYLARLRRIRDETLQLGFS
jgi:hypothetical protein